MSISFAVLTISDRSSTGEYEDRSGPVLVEAVQNSGWEVLNVEVIPDDRDQIVERLSSWADSGRINVILTTGGTGFTSRDITPEATSEVIEREAPGLAEAMRAGSLNITPHGMLSRSVAGIRKRTLIINLPGSPKAALENFRIVIPVLTHAVQMLDDDAEAEDGHGQTRAV
jgi:molybdenum cofactor synthesis domain-containing protein